MLTLLAMLIAAHPVADRPGDLRLFTVNPTHSNATIHVTLDGGDYLPGGRVKVHVEPGQDGYMVVFRVDGDGHVRVLFPLDPDLDPFVKGNKRYELRGRGERETFLADDLGGTGLIYAALSNQPLSFRQYAINDHWDYDALRLRDQDSDAEADLSAIVQRMVQNGRFDYDVTGYRVHDTRAIASSGGGFYDPSYDPSYDPYWSCLSCGYGYRRGSYVGISLGGRSSNYFGYNDPWYYDPFYRDPYAYNSYYGTWGYPYAGGGWNYPGQYRPITVVNLPRPRVPDTDYGFRARSRSQPTPADLFTPDLSRSMRPGTRSTASTGTRGTIDRGSYSDRGRVRNDDPSRGVGSFPVGRDPAPRVSQPSNRPASSGSQPGSSGSQPSSGGNSGSDNRSRRRPEMTVDLTPRTFEPAVERRQIEAPSRPTEGESRPIFREPTRSESPDRSRTSAPVERPVYREPPRVERMSPPSSAPRMEPQSSPPPPPPASSGGSDRSRRRPGA